MAQHGHPRVGSLEADQVQPYAPYGKACLNCVRSKTRCASSAAGGKCKRCQRLNKDCQPAPTVRKKRVSKKPASSTSTKTAALEEKLDGIVQMLQRSHASIPGTSQSHDQIQNQNVDSRAFTDRTLASSRASKGDEISRCDVNEQGSTDSGVGQQGVTRCLFNGPPTPATSSTEKSFVPERHDLVTDYSLETEAELEECLETYRTKMVPYFPIVCVGAEMTVGDLRKERPFLYLVIRAICSKNLGRQTALILQVKKVLGKEMLLEGTKNLDLLLGVLVFAAWCHFWICIKPIISTIVQLGISLAFDLGLVRPLPVEPSNVMLHYIASGCPKPINSMNLTRTMEERRAAVGLYLVSSVSANYFQRSELMRWTPYLDECLRLLDEKKDYPTDDLLVYLVRVQLICNKGAASIWDDTFGGAGIRIPADFYAKILKSQLEDLERSVPPGLKSNVTLQLHILSTTLSIHEYSLSSTPKSTSSDPAAHLQRIESLWVCLISVKSWFKSFFCLDVFPLSSYPHVSMAIFAEMSHCLVALYRLSTFESPNIPWDRQRVRQELDFGDVVRVIADRWVQVPLAAGIETGSRPVSARGDDLWSDNPWHHTRKKVLGIANWWDAKVAALTAACAERESGTGAVESGAVNGFGVPGQQQMETLDFGAMNIDMWDDNWMRDLLGGGSDLNFEPYF